MTLSNRLDKIETKMREEAGLIMAWRPSWIEAMRDAEAHAKYDTDSRFEHIPDPPAEIEAQRAVYVPEGIAPRWEGWHDVTTITGAVDVECVLTYGRTKEEMGYVYAGGYFEPIGER
jgi:hypothetical protein